MRSDLTWPDADDRPVVARWWSSPATADRGAQRPLWQSRLDLIAHAAARSQFGDAAFYWHAGEDLLYVEIATVGASQAGSEIVARAAVPLWNLTKRELEVLSLVGLGLSNEEISVRLGITRRTAGTHVERVLGKLGVDNRATAAAMVVGRRQHVLPLPGDVANLPDLPIVALARSSGAFSPAGASPSHNVGVPGGTATGRAPRPRRPTVLLGGIYPSGCAAADGTLMRQGAEVAVAELNRRGGVLGREVHLVARQVDVEDEAAVRSAVGEVLACGIDALTLGYTLARTADQLDRLFSPIAEYGCPVLHSQTSITAAEVVSAERSRFDRVFQVCAPEKRYSSGFIRTLEELTASGAWQPPSRRIAVLDTHGPELPTWSPSDEATAAALGWSLVSWQKVDLKQPNWSQHLDRLRRAGPLAAIFVSCFLLDALVDFLRAEAASPLAALLYTTYVPSLPTFLERAADTAEGLVWATVTGTRDTPSTRRFQASFRALHRRDAGLSSAGTHYDMAHLLAQAWSASGNPRDWRTVARTVTESVSCGVNGLYSFSANDLSVAAYPDDTRDPLAGKAHLVYQIRNGAHHLIGPEPYGSPTAFRSSLLVDP